MSIYIKYSKNQCTQICSKNISWQINSAKQRDIYVKQLYRCNKKGHKHQAKLESGLLDVNSDQQKKQQHKSDKLLKVLEKQQKANRSIWTPKAQMKRFIKYLHQTFVPSRSSVTPDFWKFISWSLVQRFFSQIQLNLGTQASLSGAVQLKAHQKALIGWLFKEGAGKLSRIWAAIAFSEFFDSNLKQLRFLSSVVYTLCHLFDYLIPFRPDLFFPFTALAQFGKALTITIYAATSPVILKSMAAGGNIGEVQAKQQALNQTVDLIAVGVSIYLTVALGNRPDVMKWLRLLVVFPLCGFFDLLGINMMLKAVQFRIFNLQRSKFVVQHYAETKSLLDPQQVSKLERVGFRIPFISSKDNEYKFVIKFIALNKASQIVDLKQYKNQIDLTINDGYILVEKDIHKQSTNVLGRLQNFLFSRGKIKYYRPTYYISMKYKPSAKELLKSLLHASYIQKFTEEYNNRDQLQKNDTMLFDKGQMQSQEVQPQYNKDRQKQVKNCNHVTNVNGQTHLEPSMIKSVQQDIYIRAYEYTQKEFNNLIEQMCKSGWEVDNFQLSHKVKDQGWRVPN